MGIQELIAALNAAGVTTDRVLALLKRTKIDDISAEEIATLTTHLASIKADATSADRIFPKVTPPAPTRGAAHAAPPRGANGNGQQQVPFDQHPGFKKRLDQEVARQIRRRLNCTIEEAEAIMAARAEQPGGGAPSPAGGGAPAAPVETASAREKKLREELASAQTRIDKLKKGKTKFRNRLAREATLREMQVEALSVGISEKHINFAISEYQNLYLAFSSNPASVTPEVKAAFDKDPVDGKAIFAFVKSQNPIGAQPPQVVPLNPTTAPPASRQPGETVPAPRPAGGTRPAPFDASKLTEEEWEVYKRTHGLPR